MGSGGGQVNGDRKYRVYFSGQIRPMGTYHHLGGRRVRIVYQGNTSTCGRCHEPPARCPGGGLASRCRERDGPVVHISVHMDQMMAELRSIRDQRDRHQHQESEDAPSHQEEGLIVGNPVHEDVASNAAHTLQPTLPATNMSSIGQHVDVTSQSRTDTQTSADSTVFPPNPPRDEESSAIGQSGINICETEGVVWKIQT